MIAEDGQHGSGMSQYARCGAPILQIERSMGDNHADRRLHHRADFAILLHEVFAWDVAGQSALFTCTSETTFDNDSRSRASSRSSQAHFAEDWRAEYDAMSRSASVSWTWRELSNMHMNLNSGLLTLAR